MEAIGTGKRVWYWSAAVLLVLVLLLGLFFALFGLGWADSTGSRLLTSLYLFVGLVAGMWAVVAVIGAVRSRGFLALQRANRTRVLRTIVALAAVSIVYCITLFATNAGEWSLSPVG